MTDVQPRATPPPDLPTHPATHSRLAGIACGVDALGAAASCRVVSAEPATAAPFALSKQRGEASRFEAWEESFVDGCGGKAVLEEVWPLADRYVHSGCAVPLPDIADAVKLCAERNRVIAEGAGACPVAAALGGLGACAGARKIVCVVSGGGIDSARLCHILQGKGVPPLGRAPDAAPSWWWRGAGVATACVGVTVALVARARG